MAKSANWLVHDHRRFEEALQACEVAAGAEDWKQASALFNAVIDDLKLHMRMEDEVIYPFFREEVDDPEQELDDLIYEHEQLTRLLTDLITVIRNRNFDHFEASLQPLYQAMIEHNAHEEAVLSRLGAGSLLERRDEILRQLEAMDPGFNHTREF